MKIRNICLSTLLSISFFSPAAVQAGNFDSAIMDANNSIDAAKAVNYEWRDSRKILKEAEKLHKAGKTHKAMQLVAKAKHQGELAVAQAKLQSATTGPR